MDPMQRMTGRRAAPRTPREWYAAHGCTHAHCPEGCEHPQPFIDSINGGELLCGRCALRDRVRNVMIPCTVEACERE
jgi:hypothetical protein